MEIRVIASIVAKTEFIEEVKAALHQIIEPSREEKGNLQYDLHTESEQKGSFVLRPLMANWKVWRLKK